MKLFCCYTPAHGPLFREYFQPSLPPSLEVISHVLDIAGEGNFLEKDFLRCIREKISLIEASIAANSGSLIIWSDVDIVMTGDVTVPITARFQQEPGLKLLFQREAKNLPDVNTGFVVIRCDDETLGFFREVARRLQAEFSKNEQAVVNDMLAAGWTIRWDYLPWSFYARTHGWPPPRDTLLYHANYTKGSGAVRQKIEQLKEFARIRRSSLARLWSCLRRIPAKLAKV